MNRTSYESQKQRLRILSCVLLIALCILLVPFSAFSSHAEGDSGNVSTLYVDPVSGDDASDGTTSATALRTLAAVKARIDGTTVPYNIVLRDGTHRLTEPFTLNNHTAGLTFTAEEGASPVISAGYAFGGNDLTAVDGKDYYVYTLPETLKTDGVYPAFRELYVNGVPAEQAATGKNGSYIIYANKGTYGPTSENVIYLDEALLRTLSAESGPVSAELWLTIEWRIACLRVTAVDYTKTLEHNGITYYGAVINTEDWDTIKNYCLSSVYYSTSVQRYYYLSNALAFLDSENEFYYDRANGKVYYRPAEGTALSSLNFEVPMSEYLFRFNNCANISFSGIDFTATACNFVTDHGYVAGQGGDIHTVIDGSAVHFLKEAAIYCENIIGLTIANCRFYGIANDAVNCRGWCRDISITGSEFRHIGAAAIRLGQRTSSYTENVIGNKNITITDNLIDGTGEALSCSPGIVIASVDTLKILRNSILNSAYSAVSIGWSWSAMGGTLYNIYEDGAATDNWKYGSYRDTDGDGIYETFTENTDTSINKINIRNAEIAYNYIYNFITDMRDGGAVYTLGGNSTLGDTTVYNTLHHNYFVCTKEISRGDGVPTVIYHDGASSHWHDYDNVIYVEPENPTKFTYVSFQTVNAGTIKCLDNGTEKTALVGGQQAYRITAERTYYINLTESEHRLDTILRNRSALHLTISDEVYLTDSDIRENSPAMQACFDIMRNAGVPTTETHTVRFYDVNGNLIATETIGHGKNAIPPTEAALPDTEFRGYTDDLLEITGDRDLRPLYYYLKNEARPTAEYDDISGDKTKLPGYVSTYNTTSPITFTVTAAKAGLYTVNMKYIAETGNSGYLFMFNTSTGNNTGATVRILNGSSDSYKNMDLHIYLQAGENNIRMYYNRASFAVSGVEFVRIADYSDGVVRVEGATVDDIAKSSNTGSRDHSNCYQMIRVGDVLTMNFTVPETGIYRMDMLYTAGTVGAAVISVKEGENTLRSVTNPVNGTRGSDSTPYNGSPLMEELYLTKDVTYTLHITLNGGSHFTFGSAFFALDRTVVDYNDMTGDKTTNEGYVTSSGNAAPITFSVSAPADGLYKVRMIYTAATGNTGYLFMLNESLPEGTGSTMRILNGSSTEYTDLDVYIYLRAGENNIRMYYNRAYFAVKSLMFTPVSNYRNGSTVVLGGASASDMVKSSTSGSRDHGVCYQMLRVGDVLTMNFTVPETGVYNMDMLFNAGAVGGATIAVKQGDTVLYSTTNPASVARGSDSTGYGGAPVLTEMALTAGVTYTMEITAQKSSHFTFGNAYIYMAGSSEGEAQYCYYLDRDGYLVAAIEDSTTAVSVVLDEKTYKRAPALEPADGSTIVYVLCE